MAYNIPEKYQDLTPAPQVDKKTLNKMVWLSCFLQASFNYERMQACGWLGGMRPVFRRSTPTRKTSRLPWHITWPSLTPTRFS